MKIGTDLSQDDLRRKRADSGNIGEVDASDAIELGSKVEVGVVALTLVSRVLGAPWNFLAGLYRARQSLHEALNFTIHFGNQLLVIAVAIQGLLQREDVLGSVITLQSLGYFFAGALHTTVAELREQYRITFTG